jgi:hypothetical protein
MIETTLHTADCLEFDMPATPEFDMPATPPHVSPRDPRAHCREKNVRSDEETPLSSAVDTQTIHLMQQQFLKQRVEEEVTTQLNRVRENASLRPPPPTNSASWWLALLLGLLLGAVGTCLLWLAYDDGSSSYVTELLHPRSLFKIKHPPPQEEVDHAFDRSWLNYIRP